MCEGSFCQGDRTSPEPTFQRWVVDVRGMTPEQVAEAIGGLVEHGLTPTTQGMVRVVGPWVEG